MRDGAQLQIASGEAGTGAPVLKVAGAVRLDSLASLSAGLAEVGEVSAVDLSAVTDLDTTGAFLLARFADERGVPLRGESEQARRLVAAIGKAEAEEKAEVLPRPPLLARTVSELGELILGWARGFASILSFLGELILAFGSAARHPSRVRGTALVHHMQHVGVNSLWIIGLMSFLIGIVIAQQGAVQLQQFGAEIYTINLTGRLAMRELGILMTAIMVAGRSGSAFAAQIGTMKLTEEVDAMRTIGVSPMEALVVPRVLAAMIMMPLLGFYSAVIAIIGGAFISNFALDIPFFTFLQRTQEVVPIKDLWVGLIKAPVFALVVALAGCFQGMQVKSSAEEVGLRTTQAVVTAIFTVIVLDAFFAVFFTEIGWA